MYTENANRAVKDGPVTPDHLEPVSKNPIIATFFRNIGRADRLGSGVRNLFKYSRLYSGVDPQLCEGDVFRIIVPLNESYSYDYKVGVKFETAIKESEIAIREPETATKEAGTATKEAEIATKEPEAATKEAEIATKEPEAATKEVKIATKEAGTATKGHRDETKEPEAAAKESGTGTENADPSAASEIVLSEDEALLLTLLRKRADMTQQQLHEQTGISLGTIKRILPRLQEKRVLQRIGGRKTGKWQVNV